MCQSQKDGVFINLIDQEESNIYYYKSHIVMCGNMRMQLTDDPDKFITITASCLRRKIIHRQILDRSQGSDILTLT